ncbi:hypothetical protein [Amycolatopsis sp. YIM 10]|uniref:hypothetical protein n=1 Tax=Amycolatopsis sp. YIM 10 TaxID=2653857 RepID=UPI001290477B|nr:hypothetical protein [Amycolatopsis sp. YIM 10]QFU87880.1 hypothetical protein YIM_13470 [Amycolatopsis sp. YIM 10]QFU94807.1 hypothetical protein YIM_48410 [Amycolatopsis sp. YIM 10]
MITLKLKDDEGEVTELTATTRDIVLWERTHRGKTFKSIQDNMSLIDFYGIAYCAVKRQNIVLMHDFANEKEFTDLFDLEFEMDVEADPTLAGL